MGDVDDSIRKDILNRGGYNLFLQNNLNIEQRRYVEDNVSKEQILNIKRYGYLQNEIESALEEFGDSMETNQKITVMVRMIEKLLEE